MIDRLPAAPQQTGALQDIATNQQPQNRANVQDVEVAVVRREDLIARQGQDFADFLNGSQAVSELRATTAPAPVFDPVAEIERSSALQGFGAAGQDQAV